jgi:hypothetical protein
VNATRRGRIVTFYSYKGGTGRSMAVANVAWILASQKKRVLVIDWDLEAPGLHRYFHPFLKDKELARSPGVIDFFHEFSAAARQRPQSESEPAECERWWSPDEPARARRLSTGTSDDATIDLVPAGRQDAAYAQRVAGFDWGAFYDKLGGGVFPKP